MRTLRDLENDAMNAAKAHADKLCGKGDNYCGITRNEIIAMQANLRFSQKYLEMYHLLEEVEKFLNTPFAGPDGPWDQDNARKELLKKIATV